MKKILLSFLSVVLIFCSTVSILAYADEDPEVGVIVEYNVDTRSLNLLQLLIIVLV